MNNNNPASAHVVTGKVRFSYCNLLEARASQPGAEPKYSVTILLPKSDTVTKQKIDAAIAAATEAGVAKKWNGARPPMIPNPVHDGDGVRPSDGMPFGDECKGCWVFTASNKQPPRIVDGALNDILDQTQIYSGMYGRASVDFFPYFAANKRGIGCALVNVQKLEDGEPLGGTRTSAEDDFGGGLPAQAPAQPAHQAPAYPQQPAYQIPAYQQPAYQQPAYGQPAYAPQQGGTYNPMTGRYE